MYNALLSVGVDQLVNCVLIENAEGDRSFDAVRNDHILFVSFVLGCSSPTICWAPSKSPLCAHTFRQKKTFYSSPVIRHARLSYFILDVLPFVCVYLTHGTFPLITDFGCDLE